MKATTLLLLIHSWYPESCCGGRDCHPVPCDEIAETATGYDWHKIHFTHMQVGPSQDSQCHVCVIGDNTPMCIFIVPNT